MAETIKIGGELESMATGNVVAAASAIKDKVKNKYQGEINAETDASLADRYTKAETYNKTELNNMITTPNQQYVSVIANSQTTAVTDVLPTTGAADTTYRVGNWDGTQYNDSVFSEYAWNGSAYIKLSTKSQVGEVYDVSANHADTKYVGLAAALGTNGANIPQNLRKGGMSIKFVQSSDNKYIRYNLIADEFTTDVTKWAIDDVGVYVDNPEFVYVKTDKNDKILWAIKTDGGIYYGAGVPQQIIDYIEEKLANLSLDEYEDIVAFLDGLIGSDTTLKMMLDSLEENKVDKEEGKSLIDSEYADAASHIDNPEYLQVTTDSEDKILEGIKTDGTKVIELPLEIQGVRQETIDNPEFIQVAADAEGKILEGITSDGKKKVMLETTFQGKTIGEIASEEFENKSTLDKFSENDGHLLWGGSSIEGDGITQAEADVRYAAKSIESTVATHTTEIEDIEASLDVNPPAVIALRNEIDQTEARVDNIENQMGITPPVLSGYKKIASETIVTQAELNSWEGCVVEIVADVKFNGSTDFALKTDCILFFNGGKFVSDSYTGTLNLNSAYVKAEPYNFFDTAIATSGYLKADICYAEWFGALGDSEHFDAICFQYANDIVRANELHLVGGRSYVFERELHVNDITIRGSKNSKIIRNPVCLDIPVITDLSNGLQPDNDGFLTIVVDNTSSDYSKLKVGMEINFVNAGIWEHWSKITYHGYIVKEINGNTIKIRGIGEQYIKSLTGTTPYSIISAYPLILGYGKFQLQNVHIDGGLNSFTSALENGRIAWWYAGTINTVAPEGTLYEIVIENCLIENCLGDGIECAGNQIKVEHNRIIHSAGNGLVFSRCNNAIVRDNYIFDSNIYLKNGHNEGAISYSNCCYNIVIDGNFFDVCLTGIGSIDTADNCQTIITNNIFQSYKTHGIDITITPTDLWGYRFREYIISNNRFIPTKDYLTNTPNESWYTESVVPYQSRPLSASGYAINIIRYRKDDSVIEGLVISNNIFKDSYVRIDAAEDAVLNNNVFLIKHTYGETEANRPHNIIEVIDNVVGVINGNAIKNYTDSEIENSISIQENNNIIVSNNMYKTLNGSPFIGNIPESSTVHINNNYNV